VARVASLAMIVAARVASAAMTAVARVASAAMTAVARVAAAALVLVMTAMPGVVSVAVAMTAVCREAAVVVVVARVASLAMIVAARVASAAMTAVARVASVAMVIVAVRVADEARATSRGPHFATPSRAVVVPVIPTIAMARPGGRARIKVIGPMHLAERRRATMIVTHHVSMMRVRRSCAVPANAACMASVPFASC
jgi:hypothetical protein